MMPKKFGHISQRSNSYSCLNVPLNTWPNAPSPTASRSFILSIGIFVIVTFLPPNKFLFVSKYDGFLFTTFILSKSCMLSLALITFPFRRNFFRFQTRHCRKITKITIAPRISTAARGMKIFKAVITVSSVIGASSLNLEVVWKWYRILWAISWDYGTFRPP